MGHRTLDLDRGEINDIVGDGDAGRHPLRSRTFRKNGFGVQLPNLPWVLGYGIRHQHALIALFILAEFGLVIAWFVLKPVERALAAEDRARPL